jgi:hypothetical protein
MDTITTMTIIPSQAALVRSADLIGGVVFTDRGRGLAIEPKTAFVVDPRPAGPVV